MTAYSSSTHQYSMDSHIVHCSVDKTTNSFLHWHIGKSRTHMLQPTHFPINYYASHRIVTAFHTIGLNIKAPFTVCNLHVCNLLDGQTDRQTDRRTVSKADAVKITWGDHTAHSSINHIDILHAEYQYGLSNCVPCDHLKWFLLHQFY